MDAYEADDHPRSGKAKIIAWCIAISAVAIIYIVLSSHTGSSTALTTTSSAPTTLTPTDTTPSSGDSSSSSASYKDGTYSASSSYQTPHSVESIDVSLTVANGTVTKATVSQNPNNHDSAAYQAAFQYGYKTYVVGKKLSDIRLSRVSGSSLTSIGFNQALDQIKSQAQQG